VEIVKHKHLCFNCLWDAHRVSLCTSRNRCRNCQRKHHTAICEHHTTTCTALNPDATHITDNVTGHSVLHTSTQARSHVLLKTEIPQVCSGSVSTDANILFDEGAQRSFISEKLATDLHVDETGSETVHLGAFGDTSQHVRLMKSATVHVITDRKKRIPIDVLITPNIAAPIENLQRNISSLTYLRGLKLAHRITTDELFEISMLIGADAYWKLIQNHIVRGNGPTAVQSKLGYFLSGPLPTTQRKQSHVLNVISSRPSCYIGTDNNKENTLTPSHVISCRKFTTVPHASAIETCSGDGTKRPRPQPKLPHKHIEYRTSSRKRRRIFGHSQQTKTVGNVVEVHDEDPRLRHHLARIELLVPGNNIGRVRAANIRTDGGRTNRPITKLYPLEIGEDVVCLD